MAYVDLKTYSALTIVILGAQKRAAELILTYRRPAQNAFLQNWGRSIDSGNKYVDGWGQVWKRPGWGGHAAGFTAFSMLAERKGYQRFPFLLRGRWKKEMRGEKEGREETEWSWWWEKEERKENGEREREKPEEGRGSRKESYDVWTLASHPAERSVAPKPASLARLEPWGSPVAPPWCGQPSPRPQPGAGHAELPPSSPPQPAHPSPPLPGPRSPPPPPTAPRAPITSLGKSERWKNHKRGGGRPKKNFF